MKRSTMLKQLQRVTLRSQGLSQSNPFGKGKKAVLAALEHLGYIQIDTLSVVERAHHHTLWTRVPGYRAEYLEQLVADRKVFEYWFHAASYLPMRDFRYALPQMLHFKRGESRYYNNVDAKTLAHVYDKIRIDGPQQVMNFDSDSKKSGSWWDWKPAKVALEKLFMQGDLMISGRDGMKKTYDLTERVLPDSIDTSEPTPLEFAEYLVSTYLRAYGVTTVKQITHLKTGKALRQNVEQVLQEMLSNKTIQQVKLDGTPAMYVAGELLENIIRKLPGHIRLLSPFDNTIIHRERTEQLFDFGFRLECYTPKEKRQYGYFCLPVLFGDAFIGRVDCKAHRKEGQLELIHLHIENTNPDINLWLEPFVEAVGRFASFNECKTIKLTKVSPSSMTETITQAIDDMNLRISDLDGHSSSYAKTP